MYASDVNQISNVAVEKYRIAKEEPKTYLMRSIVAGFYLVIAIILSNVTAAVFYERAPEVGKFLASMLFPTAIVLIVFVGGELFTGNNMVMALGVYDKKCTWMQTMRVWVMSYIGNFIGVSIFSFLFIKSGASKAILAEYLSHAVMSKLEITPVEMLTRGILCNFMVCIAVLVGVRMKSEIGKLVLMFCVIAAFVIAGFEHSIANMGTFQLAYFLVDGMPAGQMLKSMVFVTIGNVLGGAVLLAWPLKHMSIEEGISVKNK